MTSRLRPGRRAEPYLLASLPERDDWEVWAGDGHTIHDSRNGEDALRGPCHLRARPAHRLRLLHRDGAPHRRGVRARDHHPQAPEQGVVALRRCQEEVHPHLLRQGRGGFPLRLQHLAKQEHLSGHRPEGQLRPHERYVSAHRPRQPRQRPVTADGTVYFINTPEVWRRVTATVPDSGENAVT